MTQILSPTLIALFFILTMESDAFLFEMKVHLCSNAKNAFRIQQAIYAIPTGKVSGKIIQHV